MIKRIDHVGIAVHDRQAALRFFVEGLGGRLIWSEALPSAGLHWTTVALGESCALELVEPLPGPQGDPLQRFLSRHGEGVHHLTIQVEDLARVEQTLAERSIPTFGGAEPISGWKELFIHPRHAHGVLIQFAEFDPLQWTTPDDLPPCYHALQAERQRDATRDILLLGDPRLRQVAELVDDPTHPDFRRAAERLRQQLEAFRAVHGFGRGIAGPQLGLDQRVLALHLGSVELDGVPADGGSFLLLNPEITRRSEDTFTLWDDCMSFPWLRVRVRRHRHVSLSFMDLEGAPHTWTGLEPDLAELLQHEVDHLDGILAVDRAVDERSLVAREVFEARRDEFLAQVDRG